MPLWLVMIRDKQLPREPYIAWGIFDAADDESAVRAAHEDPVFGALYDVGRHRCHAVAVGPEIELGRFYTVRRFGEIDGRRWFKEIDVASRSVPDSAFMVASSPSPPGPPCARCGFPHYDPENADDRGLMLLTSATIALVDPAKSFLMSYVVLKRKRCLCEITEQDRRDITDALDKRDAERAAREKAGGQ